MSILLTPLFLLSPLAVHVATTAPDTIDDVVADVQAGDQSLPKFPIAHLSDAIHFKLQADMLTASVTTQPRDSQVQLVVPGLCGRSKLLVFDSPDPNIKLKSFTYQHDDRHDPIYGESSVNISAIGGQTMLSRFFENTKFHGEIQFNQDAPTTDTMPGEQSPVRLLISVTDKFNQTKLVDLSLNANSFTQLCREHRADVDRYFRPIVREFDQDAAIFAIPASLAWQTLGDAGSADATLRTKVMALLTDADSDRYTKRQAAIDALKTLGGEAQPILRHLDRSQLSIQQASVVDSLLADAGSSTAQSKVDDDPSFLLDVLYNDDPRLKTLAIDRLQEITGQKLTLNDAKDASAIRRLRDKLLPTTQPTF